ncbi:MAG: phytase [Hyphomonadaceae bacterium]
MERTWALGLLAGAALAGCTTSGAGGSASIVAIAETAATAQSDANAGILIPTDDGGYVIGTSESGGVEVYSLDGARLSTIEAGAVVGVDARYGDGTWTLATLDGANNRLRFYSFDAQSGAARERTARAIDIGFAGESLCMYRDARDGALYAFALGGAGEIAQYMIGAQGDGLDARLVRTLRLASEVSYCSADDAAGALYVAEQGVGFWRFDADPEAEVVPTLIDAARLGRVTEEAGGIAVYNAGEVSYVVASDASANQFHVYDRNQDYAFVGSFQSAASGTIDGVENAGGLYASSFAYSAAFPEGALLAMDDSNDGGANYKLVSWADIRAALGLAVGVSQDPRTPPQSSMAIVRPTMETQPVETDGDSADDPAIWVDRNDPARSLIIGTQKQSGLYVYDLQGQVVQFLADGRMNNVDIRDTFRLGDQTVSLVTASNRTTDSISIYRVDPVARRLVDVADGVQPTGFIDPYGLCMYRSAASGRSYVFVNDTEGGMKQWELVDAGNGRVRTALVREFSFSSQAEGCVADDETGALYVAEEDVGLWRMGAEPDAGDARSSVATVEGSDVLADDLEGIGIYDLGDGRGYLVLSSQGNNTYAVFRREGDNAYVGSFAVVADPAGGIDGISETDGLDVLSANLGGPYAHGVFVAQDGRNVSPPQFQNFKLVPWSAIARSLGLEQR